MNDPIIMRAKLREALGLAGRKPNGERRALTEDMLKTSVERLAGLQPGELRVPEFLELVEWNHSRNLIEFRYDEDQETNLWKLTPKGLSKEGLA